MVDLSRSSNCWVHATHPIHDKVNVNTSAIMFLQDESSIASKLRLTSSYETLIGWALASCRNSKSLFTSSSSSGAAAARSSKYWPFKRSSVLHPDLPMVALINETDETEDALVVDQNNTAQTEGDYSSSSLTPLITKGVPVEATNTLDQEGSLVTSSMSSSSVTSARGGGGGEQSSRSNDTPTTMTELMDLSYAINDKGELDRSLLRDLLDALFSGDNLDEQSQRRLSIQFWSAVYRHASTGHGTLDKVGHTCVQSRHQTFNTFTYFDSLPSHTHNPTPPSL
jgi:hypothetical protein